MEVIVFSDLKTIDTCFKSVKNSRNITLKYLPCAEIKKTIKSAAKSVFSYIDISGFDAPEINKILKYISGLEGCRYGIIDTEGAIKDSALLFFNGASDYIGKEIFREGISALRVKKALQFCTSGQSLQTETEGVSDAAAFKSSGCGWIGIKSGQEYTFCLMFLEIDDHVELMGKYGENMIHAAANSLKIYINKLVSPAGGKIWIWNDFGGLILFPFDGKNCEAILPCLRLILNRKIICAERMAFKMLFAYRIALHIGNTVYKKKGSTGTIVSNSINLIFHLGRKFAKPGNFYLTNEAFRHVPEKLKKYFLPAGHFEGLEIMRMILPHQDPSIPLV